MQKWHNDGSKGKSACLPHQTSYWVCTAESFSRQLMFLTLGEDVCNECMSDVEEAILVSEYMLVSCYSMCYVTTPATVQ